MTIETWLAFCLAASVMVAIPGPTVLLVLGQSLGGGRRGALPLVAGVAAGDALAMTLSLLGLGAVLNMPSFVVESVEHEPLASQDPVTHELGSRVTYEGRMGKPAGKSKSKGKH